MKELQIKQNEAGQRFDKFLKKYLKYAPGSFIYKMLRKKNITLNGKKADGSEILQKSDKVSLFFSDETLLKFHGTEPSCQPVKPRNEELLRNISILSDRTLLRNISILYEDEDIVLADKPAGMLSQKASPSDVSFNEIMIDYLVNHGTISIEDFSTFKPSVCNRLDRNTSGIISFGKTLRGVQMLSEGFRSKRFQKYYLCVVSGVIKEKTVLDGFLVKDGNTNQVSISDKPSGDNAAPIVTEYVPVCDNGRFTVLKVRLHTGKTHQIRAHFAFTGHPLAGDFKYGDRNLNDEIKKKYGIRFQLLHAYELVIPDKNLDITAPIPKEMMEFLMGEQLWESGKQEVLEALHWKS